VKLPSEVLRKLDREVLLWSPFIEKRGPMARALIEIAFAVIEAGIVERRPMAEQGLLRRISVTPLTKLTELTPANTREAVDVLVDELATIHKRKGKSV